MLYHSLDPLLYTLQTSPCILLRRMPMDANKPNDQILQIDIAAKSLRDHANSKLRQGMKGAAGLALDGNEAVAGVVDDWFSVSLCSK